MRLVFWLLFKATEAKVMFDFMIYKKWSAAASSNPALLLLLTRKINNEIDGEVAAPKAVIALFL